MAIELYFSNQLEELADKFASVVDLENQTKRNILEGPLTIVPNQNLIKWLQLTLAKRQSIFMNIDFQYLESGLWDLLARLDTRKEPPEMIDNSFLRMLLLCELQVMRLEDMELSPLSRYLLDPGNKKGPGYAIKLWQLTEKMARLFEEYEFHRSEMIQKWSDNKNQPSGMERCQQSLYLRMRDLCNRYIETTGKRLLSIREYADEVIPAGSIDSKGAVKFVHIFGLSQVSAFHLRLMDQLKDYYKIFIYALNPCREFWEDIKTPQEKKWIRRKSSRIEISPEEMDQGELLEWEGNELLALWGKPGRENIRLLCQLTDYNFTACFTREAHTPSVLHDVQDQILTLPTEESRTRRIQDTSLQIVACPGIYREVETVYNSILYNLEKDSGLQLTDIAILVPDISRYKPVIDSVFNRRPAAISYNLVDSRADIESVYGQAILGIIELATGRFSRKDVFDLIQNPCFMSKWQIEADEPDIWAGWADALNIFHSFDQKAKAEKGYLPNSRYTWKQGLQRLRLSRVMSAPDEGTGDRFRHFHGLVPFSDVNTGDVDLLEKFSVIIEKLHHAVMGLTALRTSGKEWKTCFLEICNDLLEIPDEFRGETAVQQSLIEAFGDLKIYDEVLKGASEEEETESGLEIAIIREFIKSNLRAISGGYGDYLTEGVTISALQPMRPIPFRIVYVMGMEEGAFPGKADVSSLDLRLLKRRIGDVSLPERNCYLFLEMLLSVRDKLYISHIAKDLQKDRTIPPCSVVNQLCRYVEQEILMPEEKFRITDIPLNGNSERYLEHTAVNKTSDVLVNYSLTDRIAYYRENGLWEHVIEAASEETANRIQGFFPDFTVGDERPQQDERMSMKITLKQLKKFLEDPVSYSLKRHLGIYDEAAALEEITLKEDEPFYSEFPVDYNVKMETLKLWLDTCFSGGERSKGYPLEEIYECVYDSLSRNSDTPDGAFAELDKAALRDDVRVRAGTLSQVIAEMLSADDLSRAFFSGEQTDEYIPSMNTLPVERFDAVRLIIKTTDSLGEEIETKVDLHGQLPWVWKDREGDWHSLVLTASEKTPGENSPPDKYILEPVLFWMFCLSSENGFHRIKDSQITFHVVYKEAVKAWTYRIDKDAAQDYLRILVSDYLNQERLEWLPFNVMTSQKIKPHEPSDGEADEGEKTTFQEQVQAAYAEEKSFLIRLVNPFIPCDAFDRVRDRFQVFFRG